MGNAGRVGEFHAQKRPWRGDTKAALSRHRGLICGDIRMSLYPPERSLEMRSRHRHSRRREP